MIEIKNFLLKINNKLLKKEIKKDLIRETISKIINLEIKKEEIEIKENTIFLKIKPIYKNEIFLKKEKIVLEIIKKTGNKNKINFK